jgi:hypothetical protein
MEMGELGAAEASVRCHEGDPCNGDWERYKSGFDRYQARDTFGEELQSAVRGRIKHLGFWVTVTLFFSLISMTVFFLSFFGKDSCCVRQCIDWLVVLIDKFLSLFDGRLEASACKVQALSGSLGLISFTLLAGLFDCTRRTYRKIIKIFKDAFGDARSIFAGSGQLQFSIGDCGIAVTGGNSVHYFNWSAVKEANLVKKGTVTGSLWICRAKLPTFEFGVTPTKATHLLVHMKRPRTEETNKKVKRAAAKAAKKLGGQVPLDSKDFLVIPEHFFHAPVDGCVWREFLGHFHKHICVAGWTEE